MAFAGIFGTILLVLAAMVGVILLPFALWKFFKGVGWFVSHIFTFVGGMVGDTLRLVGGVITSIIFVPLVVMNVAIGRWSASKHFWRSFQDEIVGVGHAVYRLAIGHPARLLMLTPLTEGLERRIPQALAQAPTRDTPSKRSGAFDGYTIIGSLKGGGSGGKLYIAEPDRMKQSAFARRGHEGLTKVVIKAFSVQDGSTLPQIVRESRALEAARELGLVLDHELTGDRFFYVMPYVPGDCLSVVTERLHARSGANGLSGVQLALGLGYISDLLATLNRYHGAGLWHKDIKPDNIIVGPDGRAHLVDLGLVTPLRSAMTLTTHGTEYFRDPELVRLALRGVKVHEVPGVKFDVYGAGACLFSLIEHSFPAHGGLSQISRKCPEALRWIVRRSMADIEQRYSSANEMLADLEFVRQAPDAFAVTPAQLPSMSGGFVDDLPEAPEPVSFTPPVREAGAPRPFAGTPVPPAPVAPASPRGKRMISVTDWWTGRYRVEGEGAPVTPAHAKPHSRVVPVGERRPAADQLRSARERASAAQSRARQRMSGRHGRMTAGYTSRGSNKAFWPAVMSFVFLFIIIGVAGLLLPGMFVLNRSSGYSTSTSGPTLLISDSTRTRTVAMTPEIAAWYLRDTIDDSFVVLDPSGALRDGENEAMRFVSTLVDEGADVDAEPDADVEASLLAIVGAALPGNPEATLDLLAWLEHTEIGWMYEGIVWIGGPGPGSPDAPTWQIIYAGDAPEPAPMEDVAVGDASVDGEGEVWFNGAWLDSDWWDEVGTDHEEAIRAFTDSIEEGIEGLEDRIDERIEDLENRVRDGIRDAGGQMSLNGISTTSSGASCETPCSPACPDPCQTPCEEACTTSCSAPS